MQSERERDRGGRGRVGEKVARELHAWNNYSVHRGILSSLRSHNTFASDSRDIYFKHNTEASHSTERETSWQVTLHGSPVFYFPVSVIVID